MKKSCLILVAIVGLGLNGCEKKPAASAQKPNLSPEQKEVAELVGKIKTETGIDESDDPRTIWYIIENRNLYHGETSLDEILRQYLKYCLRGLGEAEKLLAQGKTEEARKPLIFANDMCANATGYFASRKVSLNPEVKSLLKQYWDIRKRLEDYEEKGIKPIHDREGQYQKAKELHDLYYTAAAVSISYGRLEETVLYLKEATENARAAEILFDREWSKKLEAIK